jgi:N-acetylglucosaminyldiphosphoundecaprenol N-acetyl-beta-D-mannosaminyltransferase
MICRGRHAISGIEVDAIDYECAVERILLAARESHSLAVTALAVHGLVTAARDSRLRDIVNALDVVTPDGQPVRWALNLLYGVSLAERVYGPTLMLRVVDACALQDLPIFFYGSSERVLTKLSQSLAQRSPQLVIAGCESSKFREAAPGEVEEIGSRIVASGARVLFVGLGCPRQEIFAEAMSRAIDMPIISVGAAFDFHAGLLPQAPAWMQRRGLEWGYRLRQEPRRLWKRYLTTNPAFILRVAKQYVGRQEHAEVDAPAGPIRLPVPV